jgi:hypothetical protein
MTNFRETVIETSRNISKLPATMPGRQLFILFSASQLNQLTSLQERWRETFKSVNEAELIAVACRYLLDQTEIPEEEDNE